MLAGLSEGWEQEQHILFSEGYKPEWFIFRTVGSFLLLSVKTKGKAFTNDDDSLK